MGMHIGIVGSEAAKFTPLGERRARSAIRSLLQRGDVVVSGACHLGGIDVWAVEEARRMGLEVVEFPPAVHSWAEGYKPRNLRIVAASDYLVCFTVDVLPPGYVGMRFPSCYHCHTTDHIKSGGCWTVKMGVRRGIPGEVRVICN